mmetsp:Transcript_30285/g.60798  ORF Transcript_30285/g.60798 Transcript_30285/m.60798 type:complete len:167 (-) Transcript_30285:189-689(-)
MLQLGSSLTSTANDQRDDGPTSSHPGYSLGGDGRDAPLHGDASAGSFRSIVKSANATLQKSCSTIGSSINQNIQQSSTVLSECVGNKISTLRSTTLSMNRNNKDDQGIFASQSGTSWGSVKENVSTASTFTASKVAQVAQNARSGLVGHRSSKEEVSFNYQLMSDE